MIGLILIIGLFLSIYFGYQKNQSQRVEKQYQVLKTEIEKQIENINKTKILNLDEAKTMATNSQTIIEKMVALKVHQDEIEKLNSQLNNILSKTGAPETFAPEFLYDTSNIISSPQFQKIIFNDNKIYLLDSQNGRIDYFDIAAKSTKSVLISPNIKSAINIAFDKINLYLINKDSINLVEKNNLTPKYDFAKDKIYPVDFRLWNGAAYVLDSEANTIWKFSPSSTGFSKPQNWLKNDAKLDSNSVSLAINGQVWVLHQNGSITPYLSGVKTEFKPNQASTFTQTNHLDVTLEKDLIAFVDNENIVYIYQKTGELLSKYNLGNLKVNDLAFNEATNSIYLLCSDQKIYFIKF